MLCAMATLGGLLPPDPSRACVSLHSIFSTCFFLFCCSDWAVLGDPWVCLFSRQSRAGCPRRQQGTGAGSASACAAPGPAEHQNGQSWGQRERCLLAHHGTAAWGPWVSFAILPQICSTAGTIWLACLQLEREKHMGSAAAAQGEAECDGINANHHTREAGLGMNQNAGD